MRGNRDNNMRYALSEPRVRDHERAYGSDLADRVCELLEMLGFPANIIRWRGSYEIIQPGFDLGKLFISRTRAPDHHVNIMRHLMEKIPFAEFDLMHRFPPIHLQKGLPKPVDRTSDPVQERDPVASDDQKRRDQNNRHPDNDLITHGREDLEWINLPELESPAECRVADCLMDDPRNRRRCDHEKGYQHEREFPLHRPMNNNIFDLSFVRSLRLRCFDRTLCCHVISSLTALPGEVDNQFLK